MDNMIQIYIGFSLQTFLSIKITYAPHFLFTKWVILGINAR